MSMDQPKTVVIHTHGLVGHKSINVCVQLLSKKLDFRRVRTLQFILMSMDHQEIMLLVLLNLSAAFHTIDHQILLNVLESHFEIIGSVHKWFASYLPG